MIRPRLVMLRAWANYRAYARTFGPSRRPAFSRKTFGEALAMAWAELRSAARQAADAALRAAVRQTVARAVEALRPAKTLAELERDAAMADAIDATKYLPAHMSQERAIRAIHRRFGVRF